MNNAGRNIQQPPPTIGLADIYFVVFRHKWKILILTTLGIAAGTAYYFLRPPPYQTTAELLIRYVVDKRDSGLGESGRQVTDMDLGDRIIADEMHLIKSYDLAASVATNVGPDKILAKLGGGSDPMAAASAVFGGMKVEQPGDSSVIRITFVHPDPTVVVPVAHAIIDAYYTKHQLVHLAHGTSDEVIMEEATTLRQEVEQTEQELLSLKTNAGIINFDDSERSYSAQCSRLKDLILSAQVELAVRQASSPTANLGSKGSKATNSLALGSDIPPDQVAAYKDVCGRLNYLEKQHRDYLYTQGYTENNKLVQENYVALVSATKEKDALEAKYPALADLVITPEEGGPADTAGNGDSSNSGGEGELASLPVKIKTLQDELMQVQADAARLEEAGSKIREMEQRLALQESNLKDYDSTLAQARIDETLGPGRVSGIQSAQEPLPPFRDYSKFYKMIFALIFGGFFAGLAWAFGIEYFLDHSIKRPADVQNKLKIPFFLSIPDLNQGSPRRALGMGAARQLGYNPASGSGAVNGNGHDANGSKNGKAQKLEVAQWAINRRFNSYYDALRDRLVVYFESINLTRKPKLVAVTSTHRGSGVSTIAAGLAASLSETGDGRVLLVDMNQENGAAQQFFRGEASCKLDDALTSDRRDNALVQDNLYVVTEDTISDKLPRALPRRFASLIPKLKASDYDYIIFDMPPVSPTSVTSRLAGFMDTVMLVIESEKTDQQVVQQAHALLAQSKANVTAILNKTKNYIPSQLHKDFSSES
jgi:succinoglycan biosynthesis transport protein ExoP